ncbi:MAG: SDR family oxidoreductase [Rhizobiaceae bacterium]|nr:SDR family oxidoreductase [Rhizobiaceae bacterium]
MRRFDGLAVFVSGATGGFGVGIAEAFAREGARLLLTDIDADRLGDLAARLERDGADVALIAGDVTDERHFADVSALAEERFGGLDIAVNNAGIVHPPKRLAEVTADEAMRVVMVDLLGVFLAMKQQLAGMEARFRATGRPAAIVNIASVAGLRGAPMLSVYAAAKHGVVGLTRSAAAEYARRGIRINAVCPAFARTPMALDEIAGGGPDAEAQMVRGIPMRRLGEVAEVVSAVLFAADPVNGFMTGAALPVDGGLAAI